jgi:hypothetical protein
MLLLFMVLFFPDALVFIHSEKASLAKHLEKENIVSQKSVLPSEGSFQSASSVAENTSLPDLLQPEFVYKKQTDTGLD